MDWRLERAGGEKRREGAGMVRNRKGETGFETISMSKICTKFNGKKNRIEAGKCRSWSGDSEEASWLQPLGFSRSSYNTQRDRARAERTLIMGRLFLYVTESLEFFEQAALRGLVVR